MRSSQSDPIQLVERHPYKELAIWEIDRTNQITGAHITKAGSTTDLNPGIDWVTPQTPPPPPTGLVISVTGDSSIRATWSSGGGFTLSYLVNLGSSCLGGIQTTSSNYSFTGLSPNTKYSVAVCALKLTGEQSSSITSVGTTLPASQPCSAGNGSGTQYWAGSGYGACQITSCNSGYDLSAGACFAATQSCSVVNGSGVQNFSGGSYGACQVRGCNSGYVLSAGTCQPTQQTCGVNNGTGVQNFSNGSYGACQVVSCNPGYTLDNGICACAVSDSRSYNTCLNAANQGSVKSIVFANDISCPDSNGQCSGQLTGVSNLMINGYGHTLNRSSFTNHALDISNSTSISIENLNFNDVNVTQWSSSNSWPLFVSGVTTISLNAVNGNNSGGQVTFGFDNTTQIQITNCTIQNANAMGIWFGTVADINVSNCNFVSNKSNAIYVQTITGGQNYIQNSTFNHNHWVAVFDVCNGPCPGGQLDLQNVNAGTLNVINNVIENGTLSPAPILFTGGIELGVLTNINISNNRITNNTGPAIYRDPAMSCDITNFTFSSNVIEGNASESVSFSVCPTYGSPIYGIGNGPQ
jgi:hypothetical protein